MHLQAVRDAYSSMSKQYIEMVGDGLPEHAEDVSLVRRHLAGLAGSVLDLGCGPGHWTAYLNSLGADVTGVDMVPEFVAHARATSPGLTFVQAPMNDVDVLDHTVAGILSCTPRSTCLRRSSTWCSRTSTGSSPPGARW